MTTSIQSTLKKVKDRISFCSLQYTNILSLRSFLFTLKYNTWVAKFNRVNRSVIELSLRKICKFSPSTEICGSENTRTAWNVSKCGVFSGRYFPTFGLNMESYEAFLENFTEWMFVVTGFRRIYHTLHKKMNFSIKDFFSKCDQICSFMWIWSHLMMKSLMENFIFCALTKLRFSIIILENILRNTFDKEHLWMAAWKYALKYFKFYSIRKNKTMKQEIWNMKQGLT